MRGVYCASICSTSIIIIVLQLLLSSRWCDCLIIPDEVPSILSVIYSNIPTIKKGTDSRFGWGFRLGNRADFQVLTELGPQIYTQPLANQPDNGNTNNKRQSVNSLRDLLYAQQHQRRPSNTDAANANHISNSDGGRWLDGWSKQMKYGALRVKPETEGGGGGKPGLALGEIDAKSVIPADDGDDESSGVTKVELTSTIPSESSKGDGDLMDVAAV